MNSPVNLHPNAPTELIDKVTEYRVSWQREGLGRRTKLYQTLAGAEHYMRVLTGDLPSDRDPNAYACCSGWECGCGGLTNAEADEQQAERHSKFPPIVFGPVIEARPVGNWATVSAAQPAPFPSPKPQPEPVVAGASGDDIPW